MVPGPLGQSSAVPDSRWWNARERRGRPVLPVGARRPADKAREGGIPRVFRPKRNDERREATRFSRDGSPAERRVGSITGCLAGMHRRPSPHRENWAAWVSPQAVNRGAGVPGEGRRSSTVYSCLPDAAPGHRANGVPFWLRKEGRRRMEVGPETRTLGAAHGTSAPETPIAGNRQGNGRLARLGPLSRNDSPGNPVWNPSFPFGPRSRENGGPGPAPRPAEHA